MHAVISDKISYSGLEKNSATSNPDVTCRTASESISMYVRTYNTIFPLMGEGPQTTYLRIYKHTSPLPNSPQTLASTNVDRTVSDQQLIAGCFGHEGLRQLRRLYL